MSEPRMPLRSLMVAAVLVLLLLSPRPGAAAPPGEPDDDAFDYDLNSEDWENLDVNIYGDSYDYDDLDQEVRKNKSINITVCCFLICYGMNFLIKLLFF